MRKNFEEALDFFDELAKNNQSWDFLYSADRTRHDSNQNTSGHEKYTVRD